MRNAVLAVILAGTAACGAHHFPGPGNASGTVSGQVTATACGPVTPAAQPCLAASRPTDCMPKAPNVRPCGAWPVPGVELVFTNGSTNLSTKTGAAGDYSIQLPGGTWTVHAKSYMRIVSGPQTLIVSAGAQIVANYVVDTGIRAASARRLDATMALNPVPRKADR